MYLLLRHLHITCAVLSVCGFAVRGALWMAGSQWTKGPWVRRATDVNDALLLVVAVGLVVVTHQCPFQASWLTAKVLALLAYIGCGIMLFRFAHSSQAQALSWISALAIAVYIFSVAISKDPYGFLAWLFNWAGG